jgi:hypothetical protein
MDSGLESYIVFATASSLKLMAADLSEKILWEWKATDAPLVHV